MVANRPWVRRWILAGYWAVIYFLTHWPKLDTFGIKPGWPFHNADKLVHAGMFAGWITLWWWMLTAAKGKVKKTDRVWLLVGAAVYGIFDEVTQAIVGRDPDILDFSCDMLGAMTAMLVLSWWQARRRAERPGETGSTVA